MRWEHEWEHGKGAGKPDPSPIRSPVAPNPWRQPKSFPAFLAQNNVLCTKDKYKTAQKQLPIKLKKALKGHRLCPRKKTRKKPKKSIIKKQRKNWPYIWLLCKNKVSTTETSDMANFSEKMIYGWKQFLPGPNESKYYKICSVPSDMETFGKFASKKIMANTKSCFEFFLV